MRRVSVFAALSIAACASSHPWYIQAGVKASCGPPDREAAIVLDPGWNDGKLRLSAPAAEPGGDSDDSSVHPHERAGQASAPVPPEQEGAGDTPAAAPGDRPCEDCDPPPPAARPAAAQPGAGS